MFAPRLLWRYAAPPVGFLDHIQAELRALDDAGLMRSPRVVGSRQGPDLLLDGRRVLCLCSNNYLGLADRPELTAAAGAASTEYGFGACASRHISGTMAAHVAVERRAARYVRQPSALFFATGYAANLGSIQALSGPDTLVLSDALNHASLIDGCRLGRGTVQVYRHADADHARELLQAGRHRFARALLVTESLFSMDGDVAPIAALRELCDHYDCGLMVDEAHALGVLGPNGRGLCAQESVVPDLLTGTFGKAFGACGAFVAGASTTIQLVENRARSYVFSTALSPSIPAAVLAAFDLVEAAGPARLRLVERATMLRSGLRELGYQLTDARDHIIPVLLGSADHAVELSARLLELGVFAHAIRPPTVAPGTSRLRVTPMATHELQHIEAALRAFHQARI
jgi:8-amino-7-oxononanoate synthase